MISAYVSTRLRITHVQRLVDLSADFAGLRVVDRDRHDGYPTASRPEGLAVVEVRGKDGHRPTDGAG